MFNKLKKAATDNEASIAAAASSVAGGGEGGEGGESSGFEGLEAKAEGKPGMMEALQKAAQNPKLKAAVLDVQANGISAMSKYASDPEIMATLNELKGLFM
uniref:STI1 domain-containing protein n=1 Tax=Aureoumbra lagunensis TaxID=44058 RepID=A0A7S3JZ43_9STRA